MTSLRAFSYKAIQRDGKARSGVVSATGEAEAFARLRADNLSPLSLKPVRVSSAAKRGFLDALRPQGQALRDADLEDVFANLAVLLRAGADIRSALAVLDGDQPELRQAAQAILAGASVDGGLGGLIPPRHAHLRALIAAGEARGDLASGLESAARVLATGRRIRQQLFDALSYPAFVFVTAIIAVCVILLVVVPAIAPLLQDTGRDPPLYFRAIIWLSEVLQADGLWLLTGLAGAAVALYLGWRYAGLRARCETWLLSGPLGGVVRPLVFGTFAKTLGESLGSGAVVTEALRLCQRGVGNAEARKRLEVVAAEVRQGRRLSEALRQVAGFPPAVVRLAEIGEASGALGPMLLKAGEREEGQALARIDRLSKLLGPLLIVVLGGLIGGLMGGVLTALTDIGSMTGT